MTVAFLGVEIGDLVQVKSNKRINTVFVRV